MFFLLPLVQKCADLWYRFAIVRTPYLIDFVSLHLNGEKRLVPFSFLPDEQNDSSFFGHTPGVAADTVMELLSLHNDFPCGMGRQHDKAVRPKLVSIFQFLLHSCDLRIILLHSMLFYQVISLVMCSLEIFRKQYKLIFQIVLKLLTKSQVVAVVCVCQEKS